MKLQDKNTVIEGYLPVFQGFYETIFSCTEDEHICEHEDLEYDKLEFDYKDYHLRVAKSCVDSLQEQVKTLDLKVEFVKVVSPKFYNYTNDEIDCKFTLGENTLNNLIEYCKDNKKEFKEFLKDNFTSRSGFISYLETSSKKWFKEYLKESNKYFELAFTQILEFYLNNEGYSAEDMYEDTSDERCQIDYKVIA